MEPNGTPNEVPEPMEPIFTASFQRKAASIAELPDSAAFTARERFQVDKVIELSLQQYRYFSTHLLEDMPFLAENKHLTGVDEHFVTHCLMVTVQERHSCLLVDTQGYDYARYTAYVSEKERVDIAEVPVERLDQKSRNAGEKAPAHGVRKPGQGR